MNSKRKADSIDSESKLQRVVRALANATRVGTTFAAGESKTFPRPGLAFTGDNDELQLPLCRTDSSTQMLKARATAAVQPKGVANHCAAAMVWEVDGAAFELRNARWGPYLDGILDSMRKSLGIASTTVVTPSIRKMVLVGAGARLSLERAEAEKARDGVFASLVVELPSTFQLGGVQVQVLPTEKDTHGVESKDGTHTWPPRERDNMYDIQYAVFYHNSRCVIEPVATGEALYLVYDLVTTTPSEISLVAGPKALQRVLDHALTQYFDFVPELLAKQFKISMEVSRTISEFVTDHSFVYRVKRDSFEKLQGDEKRTAERLAAFCEQSQGQCMLYLVTLSCTRQRYARYETTYSVCLGSPCVRLGETRKRLYPRTEMDYHGQLAHTDFLKTLQYEDVNEADESDESDDEVVDCETQRSCTHALVVQPATLEHALWAEKPLQKVVEKLEELVETSREEALRLARRLLPTTPEWDNGDTAIMFLLDIVVKLDDTLLFNDVLRSIGSFRFEAHWLSRGVGHFGWDACITTIERILDDTTTTFRSRVNLVCLVLLYSTDTNHTDHLIQKLIAHVPWARLDASEYAVNSFDVCDWRTNPHEEEFARLLQHAFRSSLTTLLNLIGEPNAGSFMIYLIVPSLVGFAKELSAADRLVLLPLLRSLRDTLEASLSMVRNRPYARVQIPPHCEKCREFQLFLLSLHRQASMAVENTTELLHIKTVVRQMRIQVAVLATSANGVQLIKTNTSDSEYESAVRAIQSLSFLIT